MNLIEEIFEIWRCHVIKQYRFVLVSRLPESMLLMKLAVYPDCINQILYLLGVHALVSLHIHKDDAMLKLMAIDFLRLTAASSS